MNETITKENIRSENGHSVIELSQRENAKLGSDRKPARTRPSLHLFWRRHQSKRFAALDDENINEAFSSFGQSYSSIIAKI